MMTMRKQANFMLTSSSTQQAETLIRSTNARVTKTRVKVLDFLMAQSQSLTHHEIQQALSQDSDIDSVTLYRVLEWLTENELVHRIAGGDQVWRFSAGGGHQAHEHAHFQCNKCATVTCFNEVKLPPPVALPEGFSGGDVDYLINGVCPRCK